MTLLEDELTPASLPLIAVLAPNSWRLVDGNEEALTNGVGSPNRRWTPLEMPVRIARLIDVEIDGTSDDHAVVGKRDLDDLARVFYLTPEELADLLNVSPQIIERWREAGVPLRRLATVERAAELARVFDREFIATRIPEIVRSPSKRLGNRTILETLKQHGAAAIYEYLVDLFSYGSA